MSERVENPRPEDFNWMTEADRKMLESLERTFAAAESHPNGFKIQERQLKIKEIVAPLNLDPEAKDKLEKS